MSAPSTTERFAGCDQTFCGSCELPRALNEHLNVTGTVSSYPKGTIMCAEGQPAQGVYILCTGRTKVYTHAADGRTLMIGSMSPGEIVGLTAVISGKPFPATVETTEFSRVNFIRSQEFFRLMQKDPTVALKAAQQLTKNCMAAIDEIRALGLTPTVPQKIARLLLQWMDSPTSRANQDGSLHITVSSTQQEVAEMIGSTRETVSRALAAFRRMKILKIKGATWTITDPNAFRKLVK
jgi:CRP/FNR family transcriptional regulator